MKKYTFPLLFILVSFIGWLSYSLIGSEINEDGILIEPFFLIPISWLFLFAGVIWGLFVLINNKFNK